MLEWMDRNRNLFILVNKLWVFIKQNNDYIDVYINQCLLFS